MHDKEPSRVIRPWEGSFAVRAGICYIRWHVLYTPPFTDHAIITGHAAVRAGIYRQRLL
ncbi:hypothetical protein ACE6ED_22135 [Paenibacillus sp. CN-4]|uniref:hypothetical protein n=1 Tax=Paenibacillus nanchangensis TaxID=3348343 RepID=UPI003978E420